MAIQLAHAHIHPHVTGAGALGIRAMAGKQEARLMKLSNEMQSIIKAMCSKEEMV